MMKQGKYMCELRIKRKQIYSCVKGRAERKYIKHISIMIIIKHLIKDPLSFAMIYFERKYLFCN